MKVLFLLTSDNANKSLVVLFRELRKRGHLLKCYIKRFDSLALSAFQDCLDDIVAIPSLDAREAARFDCIVGGRNVFDVKKCEGLVDCRIPMFADNTGFYEGADVYGDVIFVNGLHNALNIPTLINSPVYATGCLKAEVLRRQTSAWGEAIGYSKRVLIIESGHYPFGEKGRTVLAESILKACKEHSDYFFLIKPRFLRNEEQYASHKNLDSLERYLVAGCNGRMPKNLKWMAEYAPLSNLILHADVVVHTYSSAHSEAVILGKPLINICDLPSEETPDLRKKRFAIIKRAIDRAGCSCSYLNLSKALECPHVAREDYKQLIHEGLGSVAERMAGIIESTVQELASLEVGSLSERWQLTRISRLMGILNKRISYLGNRFDDFDYFTARGAEAVSFLRSNMTDTSQCLNYIDDFCRAIAFDYMREEHESVWSNSFNRAFALRILADAGEWAEIRRRIQDAYSSGTASLDTTYYYYTALAALHDGQYRVVKDYAGRYLSLIQLVPYKTSDADEEDRVTVMERIASIDERDIPLLLQKTDASCL